MILSSPSKEVDIQNYRDIMDQEGPEDSLTTGSSSAMGKDSLPSVVAPGKKNIPLNKSLYLLNVIL